MHKTGVFNSQMQDQRKICKSFQAQENDLISEVLYTNSSDHPDHFVSFEYFNNDVIKTSKHYLFLYCFFP